MIASGDKLIDNPKEAFFAAVAQMWPKLLAVEMEGAGVAAAVHEAQSQGHRTGLVLVRGISDMPHARAAGKGASTGERDRWKQTAARNAARFLAHLVAEAWPERPRGDVRAPSDGEPAPAGDTGPVPVVTSGLVMGGAGPSMSGVMVGPVTGQTAPTRRDPAHANEEISAVNQRLQATYGRRKRLLATGAATDVVDREIVELKRQAREGGRLHAGDSLGDGRYVLVEELGRGGFAVVWKAKDEIEKRHVAIKVLHANLAGDAIRRERFYRGARAMRRLQHAGVVRVLDPEGEDGGFCYFVMEVVPNGNLHDAVVRNRVPGDAALGHILRVGEALGEAHSQGMIHRDIKPQNILLDEGFEAKLTDFDLVGTKDTTGGTRTGAMGTVIYAAPECLEKPQAATERADVYGLGMTAIFCLTGKPLTLSTLRNAESTITGLDCSPAVKEVLRRAVAWEPEARYADASAMVSELRGAMSTDLGANVVNGDAGSGAEAGGAMSSGVMSATPSAISIVSSLLAVPITPGAPMPLSPGAWSAGGLPLESQVSVDESEQGEPARSARGVSRADDTENPPQVTGSGATQSRGTQVAANKAVAPAAPALAKTTVDLQARDRAANPPRPAGVEPLVDTAGTAVRNHSARESPHRRSASVIAAIALAGTVVAGGTLYVATRDHASGRAGSDQDSVATALPTTSPNPQTPIGSDALKGGSPDSSINALFDAGIDVPAAASIDASISCNGGRVPMSGHCCWSGQTFDADKKACDGKPECPEGLLVTNVDCLGAWIGDWSGSRHQEPREFVSSYDVYFAVHLQEIDPQSGQCGSFKQVIEQYEIGSCRSNLHSCEAKENGLTANVEPSAGCDYMGSEVVSLRTVVNNTNQITVTLRDKNGQSIDEFSAGRTAAEPKPSDPRPMAAPRNPVPAPSKETAASGGAGDRTVGKGDVADSLDRAMISDGLAKVRDMVMACGEKSSAKGTVKVRVEVSPDGGVGSVTVVETPDERLGDCVADRVKKATFPRTQTGGSFRYPYTF